MIVSSRENLLCYCNCSGEEAAYLSSFCAESYDSSVVVSCVSLVNSDILSAILRHHSISSLSCLYYFCMFFVHHPSYFNPLN